MKPLTQTELFSRRKIGCRCRFAGLRMARHDGPPTLCGTGHTKSLAPTRDGRLLKPQGKCQLKSKIFS
jgi:hypothetical protein